MTRKYLGHRFKNYQHRKRHFNEPMQATVYIFRYRTWLFCADKSILRAVIWLVRPMHVLYSNYIGYNKTPILPVLNGPPSWVVRSTSKNGRSGARYRQCYRQWALQLISRKNLVRIACVAHELWAFCVV